MGETVEDILKFVDRESALERAKDDVKNKLWCEAVYIEDQEEIFRFTLDNFERVSGKLESTVKAFGITHSRHIDDFCAIPLGQIEPANRKVFLACYDELSALWNSDRSIKNAFLILAESEYDNIADFMADHCSFGDEWAAIMRKYYGDFAPMLDAHLIDWCNKYFGGFYRRDFG